MEVRLGIIGNWAGRVRVTRENDSGYVGESVSNLGDLGQAGERDWTKTGEITAAGTGLSPATNHHSYNYLVTTLDACLSRQ